MREVERFKAIGTSGYAYVIVRWAQQIPHRPLAGGVQYLDGAESLKLADGRAVNEVVPGKRYQIFDTDELLDRVANSA